MAKFRIILLTVVLFGFIANYSYGQGCSDAGFCTINSFKPNNQVLNNQFNIGASFGKGNNSVSAYGGYIEYNRQVSDRFGLSAKLTTLAQSGNDVSVFGLSDILLNANYKAGEKVQFTLGAKIPLSKSDKTFENLPLPMDYQASLGTFDLIFGIGYEIKKIQFVAAVQHPLTQNDNQFLAASYSSGSKLSTFQSTNKFQRSGDVLLRVSYPVNISSKLTLTPSVLPIYHLANDKYTDESNIVREIENSQGLTLNGNVYLDYDINHNNSVQFNVGMPFVVRESRPDGLTRSIIANLEYRIKF